MNANLKLILGTVYFSATHFLERLSYYGFRTLFLIYAVKELVLPEEASYGLYENFTLIVYLFPLIAGPFLDFVFKAKHGPVIGGLFSVLGLCSVLFSTQLSFVIGVVLIGLGSSFTRIGVYMGLGNLFSINDNRRDAAFAVDYIGISLAALIATSLIAYLGETVGYKEAFALCAVLSLLSALIPFVFNLFGGFKPEKLSTNTPTGLEQHPSTQKLPAGEKRMRALTLMYILLWSIVLWVIFELVMGKAYHLVSSNNQLVFLQTFFAVFGMVVFSIVLYFVNRRKHKLHYLYLGTLSLLVLLLTAILLSGSFLSSSILVISFVAGSVLVEVLLTPIVISYITRLVHPSFVGTAIGIYVASFALSASLAKNINQESSIQWGILILLAVLLMVGGVLIKAIGIKKESF